MEKAQRVTVWKVRDRYFESEEMANAYLAEVEVRAILSDLGICKGGTWSQDMVSGTIINNAYRLAKPLASLAATQPQEGPGE